jgi:glycosyltransferase involved in cell wall biosynthesis
VTAKKWLGDDVTVVITTIPGREDLLKRALDSVMKQLVLPAYVEVISDVDRHGAAWARNEVIHRVTTEWIAFLDDDDEFLPNHIRKMLAGANFSGADLIYTYAEFVGRDDPLAAWIDGQLIAAPINVPWDERAEVSLREHGNFIPVTNLVRTSALNAVGGFPEPYSFPARVSGECEDYGLLLRLLDAGFTFYHVVGARTWRYHVWGGNTGGRGG